MATYLVRARVRVRVWVRVSSSGGGVRRIRGRAQLPRLLRVGARVRARVRVKG